MGFETNFFSFFCSKKLRFELCPYGIWNERIGLSAVNFENIFELCPYGIWNLWANIALLFLLDLNFVPMGFETVANISTCIAI